jgi:Flp pilus assembly pilin Flp
LGGAGELPAPRFRERWNGGRFELDGEEHPMQSPVAVATLKRITNARLRVSEDGQDLLEYGLLMALIAIIALGAVSSVGQTINTVFWDAIAQNF